jgi:hypothetical protein
MPNYSVGHRDANEHEILEVVRAFHVEYRFGREGDGYDLLLLTAPMMLIEVKNPDQPPSKRQLTEAERKTLDYCIKTGVPYYVVETPEEMADILGAHFRSDRHV